MDDDHKRAKDPSNDDLWPGDAGDGLVRQTLILARRAQRGDDDAWRELDARIRPSLERQLARVRLPPGQEREDVIQEVYLDVHRQFGRFDVTPDAAFRSWLGKILRHKIIDLKRRAQAQRRAGAAVSLESEAGEVVDARALRPSVMIRADEIGRHLLGATRALGTRHAEVLRLRDEEGLSFKAIAERMGYGDKDASARVLLLRARAAVRRFMARLGHGAARRGA